MLLIIRNKYKLVKSKEDLKCIDSVALECKSQVTIHSAVILKSKQKKILKQKQTTPTKIIRSLLSIALFWRQCACVLNGDVQTCQSYFSGLGVLSPVDDTA